MDATEIADDTVTLRPERSQSGFDGYSVWVESERVGSVALRQESRSTWSIRWNVGTGDSAARWAIHAVGLAVDHVLGALGAGRVEARIPVDRTADVRAASISGLRKEGVLRSAPGETDRVLMARLSTDPPARSRDGFIAILNAGLPTKRVIAQGLWRDEAGRVLLCELTYKQEWDLPGGVIEVGESPALGLARELREELGLDVEVGDLVTVSWLPAWRGWDDACIFLFDLGVADASITSTMTLQPTEIAGVHWCDPATIGERATAAATEVLAAVTTGVTPYREAPLAPE
ncbi:NUDIX hydrolase [Aeromicrobium sp. Leaf350]|uniref:NUDIX domain-containing protein n=1 Tax=Aeromicrobium sp. Leaf350 TaxID=2876565 RepID=UPI0027151661|nr:NUDIX hydrolase [Aeromicrobium sp. Leaf350]